MLKKTCLKRLKSLVFGNNRMTAHCCSDTILPLATLVLAQLHYRPAIGRLQRRAPELKSARAGWILHVRKFHGACGLFST